MATTAATITSDIRWIMEDNNLARHEDFKVQTKRVGGGFETVIYNVDLALARQALALYASRPGIDLSARESDGFLMVTQPAS